MKKLLACGLLLTTVLGGAYTCEAKSLGIIESIHNAQSKIMGQMLIQMPVKVYDTTIEEDAVYTPCDLTTAQNEMMENPFLMDKYTGMYVESTVYWKGKTTDVWMFCYANDWGWYPVYVKYKGIDKSTLYSLKQNEPIKVQGKITKVEKDGAIRIWIEPVSITQ